MKRKEKTRINERMKKPLNKEKREQKQLKTEEKWTQLKEE